MSDSRLPEIWGRFACSVVRIGSQSLVSLTVLPDLAHARLDLRIDGNCGIRHLANPSDTPRRNVAETLAAAGVTPELENLPCTSGTAGRSLASTSGKSWIMSSSEQAIRRYAHDRRRQCAASGRVAAE